MIMKKSNGETFRPSGLEGAYGVRPEDLQTIMDVFELTPRRMVRMAGSPLYRKNERTIRRWRTPDHGGMPVDVLDDLLHWLYWESPWPEHTEAVTRLRNDYGEDVRGKAWWRESHDAEVLKKDAV
jgi:hypothetical protein